MNEVKINTERLPVIQRGSFMAAQTEFIHADRRIDFNVLIYVVRGQISVCEEDIDYEINPGEMLLLKSGLHHYGKKKIPQGTQWYYIHFYTSEDYGTVSSENFENADDNPFNPDDDKALRYWLTVPKKLSHIAHTPISEAIEKLISEMQSTSREKCWFLNNSLFSLLSMCAFYKDSSIEKDRPLSSKIADFLRQTADKPFSSKKLTGKFYLSYKHMAAVFKKDKNMTMQEYHNNLRMKKASVLLQSTLMSVGEISRTLGFSDMLYFSRCFHRYFGISPTEYRKVQYEKYCGL